MTETESLLLAHLRRVAHTSDPYWNAVHQCWTFEVSFRPRSITKSGVVKCRALVEQYREQEAA